MTCYCVINIAAAVSASKSAGGRVRFLASARCSIPAHAFSLKKYLGGIEPVSSTCDNEHTTASLGQAEILGVQDPPRDCSFGSIHTTSVLPFLPWRLQLAVFPSKRAKKASEGVPFIAEDTGDVLPDDD